MSMTDQSNNNCIATPINNCAECGGDLEHDRQHALRYCEDCGLVVEKSEEWLSCDPKDRGEGLDDVKDTDPQPNRYRDPQVPTKQRGVYRRPASTTFSADGKDANANHLPQEGDDGRDLGIQRRYMWLWQDGHMGNEGKRRQSLKDRFELVEILGSRLALRDHVVEQAKRLAARCNAQPFSPIGAFAALALGCLAVATNQWITDYSDRLQVRDHDWHDGDEPLFRALADEMGVDWQSSITIVKKQMNGR